MTKKQQNEKQWYQFQVTIDRLEPENSDIWFSANPTKQGKLGEQVNEYLIQSGFERIEDDDEDVLYTYNSDDPMSVIGNLYALYEKFKNNGASIAYKDISADFVSRREFEEVKEELEQLKKELAIAEDE